MRVIGILLLTLPSTTPLEEQTPDFCPLPLQSRVPYGTDVTDFEPVAVILRGYYINIYQVRLRTIRESQPHFAMRVMNRYWVLTNEGPRKRLEEELELHRGMAVVNEAAGRVVVQGVARLFCFYNVCWPSPTTQVLLFLPPTPNK